MSRAVDPLPPWARAALATFPAGPARAAIAARFAARWSELAAELLPALGDVSDVGKQLVLEQGVWAALYFGNPAALTNVRNARAELDRVNAAIGATAATLAALLRQREGLQGYGVHDSGDTLPELLALAAERFPEWAAVAEIERFVEVALTQSRPGPELADLLDVLAASPARPISPSVGAALASRKAQGDRERLLIAALDRVRQHPALPVDFALPAPAIAALARVVFDLPAAALSDKAVAMQRRRMRER